MSSAPATESREKVLERFVLHTAIIDLLTTLQGSRVLDPPVYTFDGRPFARFFDEGDDLDYFAGQLVGDEIEELWPGYIDLGDQPGYLEAEQRANLLTVRMLIALAGSSEFFTSAADRLLATAVKATDA